jgi:His-Xaa-Ser system protein HxsD
MKIELIADLLLFSEATVLSVVSAMNPQIDVLGINKAENQIKIQALLKNSNDAGEAVSLFNRKLIEQRLKDTVYEKTKDIRTLIMANAFSKTSLIDN